MVFYSNNSREKVYHLPHCSFVRVMNKENRKRFSSPEQARQVGYRLCNCCSPVGQRLRKERQAVTDFCQNRGVAYYMHDGQLTVTTPRSKWKIVVHGKENVLTLYHRNAERRESTDSPIPKYHYQSVHRNSIVEYLDYIVEHDYYRMRNPYQPHHCKTSKPPKGSKRWKKQQEKEKRIAKYQAVQQVYALLDTI